MTHPGYKLSDQQKLDVVSRYLGGENAGQLAKSYGVHRNSIHRILEYRGVKLRRQVANTLGPDGMKLCPKCKLRKPASDFGSLKSSVDKLTSWCRKCSTAKARAWVKKNREHHRVWSRSRTVVLRTETIQAYGGKCVCCGEGRIEFLAIDHKNGGGRKHRKMAGTGSNFYRWLKRNGWPKDELQLLCHNCNCSRGYYGYCPCQKGDGMTCQKAG